ncbi:MAG: LysR family transcriptional regulator [Polyangiales bacterium]
MTLDDLRSLIAVHESKSFSAAARRLGCTQPAVSQHIARLEGELGLALFERQSRGVQTTPAGELLVRAAGESLSTLDHAAHRLAALRDGEAGSLVVTTGGTTVHHFMRGAVKEFRRLYPRVEVQFRGATSSAECIETLLREPVDLAFVTIGEDIEGIRQLPLLELDYVLLIAKSHPLAKRSKLKLADLNGLSCIGLFEGRTSRSQLASALAREGVTLETAMLVCDWDTQIALVELGLGSTIVPSWHAHASVARADVTAIPIAGLAPIRVGWALRESYTLLSPARELMRLLKVDLRARPAQPGVRLRG